MKKARSILKTHWFYLALTLAGACSEDSSPEQLPAPGLEDAGALQDASSSYPLDTSIGPEAGAPDSAAQPLDAQAVDAEARDAETGADGGPPACTVSSTQARCNTRSIEMIGASGDVRRVYWARPTLPAPAPGYPVVLLFQGTGQGPAVSWDVDVPIGAQYGGYYQVALIAKLLEHGFVVVQPEASGGVAWSTNGLGDYATSSDGVFIPLLLAKLAQTTFGPLDLSRLYATGISSGGYMTSRMAVSYPGKFRALAIMSGSYATCLGPLCTIPAQLPKDHPPTLLLHGGADFVVGIATARDYESKLKNNGIEAKFVEDSAAGHQWINSAPAQISDWFSSH